MPNARRYHGHFPWPHVKATTKKRLVGIEEGEILVTAIRDLMIVNVFCICPRPRAQDYVQDTHPKAEGVDEVSIVPSQGL